MTDALDQITETFGVGELEHALFYEFEFALRFELGGEVFGNIERPIPRFLQAFKRARAVASHVFPDVSQVRIFSTVYGDPNPDWIGLLRPLRDAGFRRDQFRHLGSRLQQDDDPTDTIYRHWYECPISDPHIMDEALWLSIAQEMPIKPRVFGMEVYLMDFERGVAMHIYDDRGMDIIATTREPLQSVYDTFGGWLLGYDIDRMKATFG